ncbi:2768_t:CDS:2, partial [Cetraspora pellucida]
KITGNRYLAKCIYCQSELPGRPEKLHNHVLKCGNWPVAEKTNYIKNATSYVPSTHKKIKVNDEETASDNPSSSALRRQESIMNWCIKLISEDRQGKLDRMLLDAIIYGNLSFRIVRNPYFLDFLYELAPNYDPPSDETLRTKVLNSSFSTYLAKKLELMTSLADTTIALDGWQDISRNSIYGFMALKEDQEYVLDIIDLSSNQHTA